MKKLIRCGVLTILLCLIGPQVQAAKDQFNMNINISGTVVANDSCTFVQGKEQLIDFGDVFYRADNNQLIGNYRKKLNTEMSCRGDVTGAKARMTLTVTNGYLARHATLLVLVPLGTNPQDLSPIGIALLVNGVGRDFDSPFMVDMAKPPVLEMQLLPLLGAGSWTMGTSFNGSAMLLMEFV